MDAAPNTIAIAQLTKAYVDEGNRVAALKSVSLDVPAGSIFTFLGPSGCGKTTTLRCIAGLERPDEGRITIDGGVVFSGSDRVHVPVNKRPIGMVFQSYAIWPHMTVLQNVTYPLRVRGVNKDDVAQRAERVLGVVGLTGLETRPAPKLSGGQQQRVALARALITEPKVLLLDEPLSNLDAKLREQMRREIKLLQRRVGITTVYVTHDQSEAMAISDQIAIMNSGELVEIGTPLALYSRPRRKFTATFLGVTNLIHGTVAYTNHETAVADTEVGRLAFMQTSRLHDGDTVLLSIRPEDIRIGERESSNGSNQCSGTVRDVTYMGDSCHCEVIVGQHVLRAHVHPSVQPAPGATVYLSLPAERCTPVSD